ncbi:MAG: M20/M25/M40 family metallo-hydrolase, partial [Flavobacteriaceae bacterium]
DHDLMKFKIRKDTIKALVNDLNRRFDKVHFEIEIKDQYFNMKEKVTPMMHIVDIAEAAMKALNIKPLIKPIRGGTDGSQLSYMGLPCPNIFAGGHNFHGRYEYVPLESILSATEVICKIAALTQERYQ